MSISWSLGTFKDRADEKQQLDRYFKMLSMQAEINAKQRDIENQAITRSDLRLDPVFTEKSSVDRMKDGSLQRELAYNRLKTIFSSTDTDSLLASFIAKDEVLLFNTYADKFFDEYRINDNISTSLFQTNWNLFLKKLSSAENIGNTLSDIKDILEGNRADTKQLLQDISASSLSTNEKLEAIREVAQESFVNGAKLNDIIKDLKASGISAADVQRIIAGLPEKEDDLIDFQDRQPIQIEIAEAKEASKALDALGADGLIDAFNYLVDNNFDNDGRDRTSVVTANGVQRSYPTSKLLQEPINLNYLKSAILKAKYPLAFDSRSTTLSIDNIVSLVTYRGTPRKIEEPLLLPPVDQKEVSAYMEEMNEADDLTVNTIFIRTFKNKAFVPGFGNDGKRINVRHGTVLNGGKDGIILALTLNKFPGIDNAKQIFGNPDLIRSSPVQKYKKEGVFYFRELNKLKLEELKAIYDAELGQKDWIPTFSHEGKMISKRKDFLDLNDRNNLINALVLKQFPKINEKDLSRPPQAPEQATESAYYLNVIDTDQSELKEEPRWQFRQPTDRKQMENDTRDARDFIAGLWNMKGRGDQALKTYVTRTFNGVFANIPEDKNIMVWSNRDKNAVGNQKGIIKKYYKKIEALTLNRFPNADLTGISIPFEKSADHPYGLGLPKVQVPKHKAAGRYLVHIPSLQRGYLYIQYPSGWRIAHFKKQAISSDMQTMIWNMIDDKQFDSKLYKKLKADEKKLYDEVVHMIRVPVNEIKGLGTHKKLTDTERDNCMKRLKILTGEVMAGSNSKKTIKELKILVLQMLDKGYISRADFNKIIHQIMIVEE